MSNEHHTRHPAVEQLPNRVKQSWGLEKQAKRGPKGELSVAQIVKAAVALADKDGLSAVSMNRVAASLGYTTMSLYRYISSKEDLLFLMQDAVCEVAIPDAAPSAHWRSELRDYVHTCIRLIRQHPWYSEIPVSGAPLGPHNLKLIDWALRPMRPFQLNDFEKMSFVLLLSSYARTVAIIASDLDQAVLAGTHPGDISGLSYTEGLKQLVQPEQYPHLYPVVASGAYTGESADENTVDDDFEFGLERILDGIEHYLTVKAAMPMPTPTQTNSGPK